MDAVDRADIKFAIQEGLYQLLKMNALRGLADIMAEAFMRDEFVENAIIVDPTRTEDDMLYDLYNFFFDFLYERNFLVGRALDAMKVLHDNKDGDDALYINLRDEIVSPIALGYRASKQRHKSAGRPDAST